MPMIIIFMTTEEASRCIGQLGWFYKNFIALFKPSQRNINKNYHVQTPSCF